VEVMQLLLGAYRVGLFLRAKFLKLAHCDR